MCAASVRRRLLVMAVAPLMAACAVGSSTGPSPTDGTSPVAGSVSPNGHGIGPRPIDVRTALDVAAFVTPAGQIVCMLGADGVRCDYFAEDKAWEAPHPGNCDLDWGSSLSVDRTAGTSCVGDSIVAKAALDSGLDSWRKASDPMVPWNGMTLVALPYGATIVVGTFRCDSATDGVTCTNESTGHGFFMSRESIRIF
jgi:hypothetical protein